MGGHAWRARGARAYNGGLGGAPSGVQGHSPWSGCQGAKPGKSGVDMSTPVLPVATPLIINLPLVLRSLKRRCYSNLLILGANSENRYRPPSFFAVAFHEELEYRHANVHCACINSGDDVTTPCRNLVRFGQVTP